jgi:hypothetical protein
VPSPGTRSENEVRAREKQLRKELEAVEEDLAWEIAKTAVDAAGLVDPTPVSDAVGAGMSLKDGDLLGAGLSVMSMFPYIGDAIGKPAKRARAAKRIAALKERVKKIMDAIEETLGKLKRKPKSKVPKKEEAFDHFDEAKKEYPNSPYVDKKRHPREIRKEIEEKIEKDMAQAVKKGNEKIARQNAEIEAFHKRYVETGEWHFEGLDDWQFPDEALRAKRQEHLRKKSK